jgi:hypothetical protein
MLLKDTYTDEWIKIRDIRAVKAIRLIIANKCNHHFDNAHESNALALKRGKVRLGEGACTGSRLTGCWEVRLGNKGCGYRFRLRRKLRGGEGTD